MISGMEEGPLSSTFLRRASNRRAQRSERGTAPEFEDSASPLMQAALGGSSDTGGIADSAPSPLAASQDDREACSDSALTRLARERSESHLRLSSVVHSQMMALEDRFMRQVTQVSRRIDKQIDGAVQHLHSRLQASECAQPKLSKRLAELGGQVKVLGEEMASQTMRTESLDARLGDWRREPVQVQELPLARQLFADSDTYSPEGRPDGVRSAPSQHVQDVGAAAPALDSYVPDWLTDGLAEVKARVEALEQEQQQQQSPDRDQQETPQDQRGHCGKHRGKSLDQELPRSVSKALASFSEQLEHMAEQHRQWMDTQLDLQQQVNKFEQQIQQQLEESCAKHLHEEIKLELSTQLVPLSAQMDHLADQHQQQQRGEQALLQQVQELQQQQPQLFERDAAVADALREDFQRQLTKKLAFFSTQLGQVEDQQQQQKQTQQVMLQQIQEIEQQQTQPQQQRIAFENEGGDFSGTLLEVDSRLTQMERALLQQAEIQSMTQVQKDESESWRVWRLAVDEGMERVVGIAFEVEGLRSEVAARESQLRTQSELLEAMGVRIDMLDATQGASQSGAVEEGRPGGQPSASPGESSECIEARVAEIVRRVEVMQEASHQVEVWQQEMARRQDEWQHEVIGYSNQQFEQLMNSWEAIQPSIAEHDRCTRVVLRDVLPRLGSLSDAQDEIREALTWMASKLPGGEPGLVWPFDNEQPMLRGTGVSA